MQSDHSHFEDSSVTSYKAKHTHHIIQQWCPFQNWKCMPTRKPIYECIYTYKNMGSTKMFFSKWTNCSKSGQWNIILCWKEMTHRVIKRHGGNLHYHQLEKVTCNCLITILWHPRTGKTIETVIKSEHRGFLGQWNCCVWYYNCDYMSLYTCIKPRIYKVKS
jgi:hypothetical protein